ncbi:MAG: transposase [Clostridia bacterium]|nr:transposase [Clostridia bacterium]
MPRQARIKSKSGIYHIMLRGINQEQIFEDEEDNLKFLKILKEYKEICQYKVYAYCLMGNHLHLLLKEEKEELQSVMKRIAGKYVYWFNTKYKRIGHLFQDRFKSEPVEDNKYFLTVLRYIHQNPLKAQLAENINEYPFNSYKEYLSANNRNIIDTELVLNMIGIDSFIEFHQYINNDSCLDLSDRTFGVTDEEAKRIIQKISTCKNANEFQQLKPEIRNKLLAKLKNNGLSIRQISRLTGISKGIIERT